MEKGPVIFNYMDVRSIEALKYGYRRITTEQFDWGSITYYHDIMETKFVYATPYVIESLRKDTGIFLRECEKLNNRLFPILTLSDCNLISWYKRKNIKYTCPNENNDIWLTQTKRKKSLPVMPNINFHDIFC